MIAESRSSANEQNVHVTKALFDLLLLAVAVLFVATSYQFPASTGLFSRVVGYPIGVLALVMVGLDIINLTKHLKTQENQRVAIDFPLIPLIFASVYGVLFFLIGFDLATVLYLTLLPLVLRQPLKRMPVLFVTSVVITVLFVYIFGLGSGVILPSGIVGGLF